MRFCGRCGHEPGTDDAFCDRCGARLEAARPVVRLDPTPPPAHLPEQRSRGRRLVIGALILLVLATGAVAGISALTSRYGPERAVEAYLGALADGDVAAALDAAGGVPDDVLPAAAAPSGEDRVSGVEVREVDVDGGTGTVRVRYAVDGEPVIDSYEVERTGTAWLLLEEWRVVDPLGELEVSGAATVTVNGAEVSLGDDRTAVLPALPGRYEVTMPPGSAFRAEPVSVLVSGVSATSAELALELAPQSVAAVRSSVAMVLSGCAEQATELLETGCPFQSYGGYGTGSTYTDVRWTVQEQPELTFEVGDQYTRIGGLGGRATVTAIETVPEGPLGPAQARPFSDESRISVAGTVTIDENGKLSLRLLD